MLRPFIPAQRQIHAIPFPSGSGTDLSFAQGQVNQSGWVKFRFPAKQLSASGRARHRLPAL
jgi:hypothetical protein